MIDGGDGSSIDWKRIFFILLGLGLSCSSITCLPGRTRSTPRESFRSRERARLPSPFSHGRDLVGVRGGAHRGHEPRHRRDAGAFRHTAGQRSFGDFMDPSVMFIGLGRVGMGLAFTKTGLTRRLAYKMLEWWGSGPT